MLGKRIAAIAAALATGLALSLGAATAASASVHPAAAGGACYNSHPGFTGTWTSEAGFSLAIGSGAPQAVAVPNFNNPFGTQSCIDFSHPDLFAADNGAVADWHFGASDHILSLTPAGKLVFRQAPLSTLTPADEWIFVDSGDGIHGQFVNGAQPTKALSLGAGFLGMGGASVVPAGGSQLSALIGFTAAN